MNDPAINQFLPHGYCISWDPLLLGMHVGSDVFIALAYFSIPIGIIYAVTRRKELSFAPIYYLFATFILACGFTHVLGIWTLWNPAYYLQGYAKVLTALVSMATAIYLLPKLPQILALPSLDQLTAINEELKQRIDAQTKAEAALKEKSAELERALALQNEFLVNMSHEVRTPMTGILGCLNLAKEERLTPNQAELIDDAQASAKSLMGLLNSLLDLSKMDANELALITTPTHIERFTDECVNAFRGMAREKGLTLASRVEASHDHLAVLDAIRLRQVLQNLISNAIKFTDNGRVDVLVTSWQVDALRLGINIEVCDTGHGIAPEDRERVFERFFQVDGSTTRKAQGTGLGLAICKQLVELMNGTISLKASGSGGCRFIVELTVPLLTEIAKPKDALGDLGMSRLSLEAAFDGLHGKRLLVVDDVPLNRKIIQKMLVNHGLIVDVARDGAEALATLEMHAYDLVLMDCQMPLMDGYQATQRIRQGLVHGVDKNIPVIALTGHATKKDQDRCLEAGMNDYLVKPLDLESFLVVVKRYLLGHKKPKLLQS